MKLGLIAPTPSDATSFYRAYGVMCPLARECDIQLVCKDKWSWEEVAMCDLIFMQRPWVDAHRNVAELAKKWNVPLWLDYDDNLFAVQRSNPAYHIFMNQSAHTNMRRMMELADEITVTTGALTSVYKTKNGPAKVVPNALHDYVVTFADGPRAQTIVWRGGVSHYGDMMPFIPGIKDVARDNPGWDWHFMGDCHWDIETAIPADQRFHHPFRDIFTYFVEYAKMRPSIHIVPLVENSFNFCKSNLAYVEAAYAGAVCLAPDWTEWRQPGCALYKDVKDFEVKLRELLSMQAGKRWDMVSAAREHISKNLCLSKVNQMRVEILNKLCESNKQPART